MTQSETDALVHEIRVRAPRETVFAYFTDPVRMVEWFGQSATLDPRPGGTYRVKLNESDVASGAFVEVEPPERAVFTFGWEHGNLVPPGASTVEVNLIEDGDATVVRLTHRGLPTRESVEKHEEGWTFYLAQLADLGEHEESADAGTV